MPGLRLKIFLLFFALLVLVEAVTLVTIYFSMREQVGRSIAQQLDVGREVFLAQFDSRRRHLSSYSEIIAKDFGLLSALHDDPRSLQVALDNHRNRVGADIAIITDLEHQVLADTGRNDAAGTHFKPQGSAREKESFFLSHARQTYQVVAAPLLAPKPVGHLYLGFFVNDELARQFESITALQVSFLSNTTAQSNVIASTLPGALHPQLAAFEQKDALDLDGNRYISLAVPLGDNASGTVTALLMQSEDDMLAAYRPWWRQIAEVALLVLLAGLAGAWALARTVVQPLRTLAGQAEAIAHGDYSRPIAVRERGEIGELASAFSEMQRAIAEREASIRFNAYHDPLTGLINRYRLEQVIEERLGDSARRGARLGVLVIDLDRFKDINDTLGYHAGDRLLRDIGLRLEEAVGDSGVVARLGGDEFGVVLHNVSLLTLNDQLDALVAEICRPFQAEELALHVSAGIGTAVFPEHGKDALGLLRHADAARFVAKEKRLRHVLYDGAQDRYSLLRVSLLGEMQQAMERGDLLLHYQPKLDLRDNRVHEAEALLRWQHPTYGMIPPNEFIPMVERTGNIPVLTRWLIDSALRQLAAWAREGIRIRVAINITAHDLRDAALLPHLRERLERTGVSTAQLKFEITESAVVEEERSVMETLAALHGLGIALSIDDYGTGYSSLAQLKNLPVEELKIDKSFVLGLDRNHDDELIVRSTVDLGHTMGLRVCAEGVESQASLAILRKLGCELAQGFHIARPMPVEQFTAWLRAQSWLAPAGKAT